MADSRAIPSADSAHLRRTPLSLGFKAVYGAGTMADIMVQTALNLFLFFYLTAVCGLSNSLAGLSLFVALVVDAVGDPLVGSLSDNSWTRWGRRHPFMLVGALPLALSLGLLFSIPPGLTGWGLFAYATVCSIAVRVSHSVFLLPYTALGAELSDDYAERTNIVAARTLFTVLGTFACVGLGMMVFLGGPGGLLHRAGYAPFAWVCAGIGLVGALITIFGTLSALPRLHRVAPVRQSLVVQFVRDIAELFRNRSFVVLFITLLLLFTGQGVSAALTLHSTKFFWNLPPSVIQGITLAAPLGLLIGVPISVLVSNRFEKSRVVLWALLTLTTYYGVMPVLQILHVLPVGMPLWIMLIVMTVGVGAVTACAAISFNSMMADAADEHEAKFGTRREALYFAGLNFSAKAASGLGSLVAGLSLDAIGFPTNLAAKGAQVHIAASVVRELGLIVGPGVGSIFAIAIAVFAGYRLDRAAYAGIQRTLDERRRQAA